MALLFLPVKLSGSVITEKGVPGLIRHCAVEDDTRMRTDEDENVTVILSSINIACTKFADAFISPRLRLLTPSSAPSRRGVCTCRLISEHGLY